LIIVKSPPVCGCSEDVFPQAAGILFTADPVTSNRKVLPLNASFGLGRPWSPLVNLISIKLCNSKIIDKKISTKKLAIYALKDGGTKEQEIEPERQTRQALTDEQILLTWSAWAERSKEHFGAPQDIEWCFVEDTFYIVQSGRSPLYIPFLKQIPGNHVYVSVGHQK